MAQLTAKSSQSHNEHPFSSKPRQLDTYYTGLEADTAT